MSAAKQADISATAADTFHENGIAFDEENGVSAVAANNINANTGPTLASTSPTNGKSRMGWIVGGTAALLFIIGLSVGLTNNKNDNSNNKEVAANAEQVGAIATEPRSSDDLGGIFSSDDTDNGTVREEGTLSNNPFIPETDVGDSAMMTWPQYEEAIASTTSSPTTLSPTPARSGVPSTMPSTSDPKKSPSGSPSKQPTFEPSNSPSKSPSLEPTKSPTDEPTKSPSTSPSSSPSKEPTPKPSTSPTLKPTSEPSKQPTSRPTTSPSKRPTSEPTKKPTNQPTNQPTSEPTNKPTTPQPTSRPTPEPTNEPSDPPTTSEPFFFGEDFYTDEDLGIEVSRGLNVRLIVRTGRRVKYANGDESKLDYHTKSDAAGIIPMNPDDPTGDDGYVYVTNSEEGDGDGGVYGLYFDKDGNILDYKALLTGTTDNCGGGISPWNTFISCEEYEGGQCWQIDPVNGRTEKTKLGGSGGRYESVAVDNRNPDSPVFFTTEDHEEGAMRRFVADGSGWDALHSNGDTTFLNILGDGEFEWTDDEDDGRDSASEYFPNTEGVQFHDGKLYFMAKKIQRLIILDLDNMTYETEGTGKKFYGEGSFGDQPDQNFFGPTQKLMYFTEDGGDSPGVYARSGSDGTYFTMFQAIKGGMHSDDETIGIALSPDHKRFYAGIQDNGYIFEFTREDGQTFE